MDGSQIRIPPYVDARRVPDGVVPPLAVPSVGPALIIIWPDAPDRRAVERVARALERALRAAWPPVATDSPDTP